MKKPKVGVFKLYTFNSTGKDRWFGAELVKKMEKKEFEESWLKEKKRKRPRLPVIDLKEYPNIKTEKDLVKLIYDEWGYGTYMVIAFGGRANTFVFWKGRINEDGFVFFQQKYDRKEVYEWKRALAFDLMEGNKESAEDTKDIIKETVQDAKEEKKNKRYGFYPFLKNSGRRGQLILWDSPDIEIIENNWGEVKNEEHEDWGEVKEKEFEKW